MYFQEKGKKTIREDKEQFSSYETNFLLVNKAKMICVSWGIWQ